MTFEQYLQSLEKDHPPEISLYLDSLWYDKKGDWDKAHQIAQDLPDKNGSWIHAYLHREEGDKWNANYWYDISGRSMPSKPLEEEWEGLVRYFIKRS
jgi:hypothetical protein